jgi:glycosyltransferase involved in cell wall biosynthesis
MSKLIVSGATLAAGGAERVLSVLSAPLADRYDTVIYVMWLNVPVFYKIDNRVRIVCIEKEAGTKNDIKKMLWFREFIKKEHPDILLSFLEPFNIRVLISTMGLGIKTFVAERNDPHGVNKYWVIDQFEKLVYRLADKILVQTETIKKFFDGALAERTTVIYNPVNLQEDMVGKALTVEKKKRIVSVARLTPQKNNDVLIKAFAKFSESHPDYTLTIYGIGELGNELKQLAESLGVGEKVSMPGASKTIHEDILDAEMMCLVSSREGMSNAMIESMCLGLPCICTKVSGAIDLIRDGENGILVNIRDEEALYEQMCRVADDKEFAGSIGMEASHLYDILRTDRISKQWIDCLDKC